LTSLGFAVFPYGAMASQYLDVLDSAVKHGWKEDKPELDAWMKEYLFMSNYVWNIWGVEGLLEIREAQK